MTNKELKTWYLWYNKYVFGGELPLDTLVTYRDPTEKRFAAELLHELPGGRHLVYIKPLFRVADCYVLQLLLHEQIHLFLKIKGHPKRVYSAHGKLFKAEQKRIEELGVIRGLW